MVVPNINILVHDANDGAQKNDPVIYLRAIECLTIQLLTVCKIIASSSVDILSGENLAPIVQLVDVLFTLRPAMSEYGAPYAVILRFAFFLRKQVPWETATHPQDGGEQHVIDKLLLMEHSAIQSVVKCVRNVGTEVEWVFSALKKLQECCVKGWIDMKTLTRYKEDINEAVQLNVPFMMSTGVGGSQGHRPRVKWPVGVNEGAGKMADDIGCVMADIMGAVACKEGCEVVAAYTPEVDGLDGIGEADEKKTEWYSIDPREASPPEHAFVDGLFIADVA
jgi:hypothetical protein